MNKKSRFKQLCLLLSAAVVCTSADALNGSTWKVMIVKNDLNHPVKLNNFSAIGGTFILAKLENGVVVNNNNNYYELSPSAEIVIPANSSIDSKTPGSQLNFTLSSMSEKQLRNSNYNTLVFVLNPDLYHDSYPWVEYLNDEAYGSMSLYGSLSVPEIYYGYSGFFAPAQDHKSEYFKNFINFTYFIGSSGNARALARGVVGKDGVFSRTPEILYDLSATHLYGPAYNEISIAKDVCANQSTIGNYLDCFKD